MKSHCNTCGGDRNQTVLHQHQVDVASPNYSLLSCDGCGEVSFRVAERGDKGEHVTKFYPPRMLRPLPRWALETRLHSQIPASVRTLVRETYFAFYHDCRMSTAMCVRAVIETVMVEKVGDNRTFTDNLRKFVDAGYVSPKQRDALVPIIETGSAAIHRAFVPTTEQLAVLLDVMEALVHTIYIQPLKTAALKSAVPVREK